MLRADWTKSSDSTGTLTFAYAKKGRNATGNSIEYGRRGSLDPYNAYYYISKAGIIVPMVKIEWNTTSKEGRNMAADYLWDNLWHCRDSSFPDKVCS